MMICIKLPGKKWKLKLGDALKGHVAKCQSEISALGEELSKFYAKINELSLKVQQLSLTNTI